MEELRAIFLNQINNIPFIECIDENQFYDEFLNSPVETINQELILSEILKGKNISEINSEDEQKFNAKLLEIIKTKNKNYYIPDITRTKIYQKITKINEIYTDFLFLISEKKKYQIVEGKNLKEIPERKIIYDRFSDPKINAERILQILEYFNDDIQHRIIQKIINDNSAGLYSVTEKNNPNFQETKYALENFRKFLHELDKKSNPIATQNDNQKSNGIIQKDENKITDDVEGVINCNLCDFLQEKKINENDYETLVKALLQYVKQGVFPYINEKIVIKTSMKKFGWAVNSILKECDLKINSGVLKFAQNNISLFENNKEVFDETNFRKTYIYKLFTENPYKNKNI
jgi:hypothetical protein